MYGYLRRMLRRSPDSGRKEFFFVLGTSCKRQHCRRLGFLTAPTSRLAPWYLDELVVSPGRRVDILTFLLRKLQIPSTMRVPFATVQRDLYMSSQKPLFAESSFTRTNLRPPKKFWKISNGLPACCPFSRAFRPSYILVRCKLN